MVKYEAFTNADRLSTGSIKGGYHNDATVDTRSGTGTGTMEAGLGIDVSANPRRPVAAFASVNGWVMAM